jgi:hypothetical protein
MTNQITRWLTGLMMIAGAVLFAASPAAAARPYKITDGTDRCFTYEGVFIPQTRILMPDWDGNGDDVDECFGVAPDRTIWHTWRGAGDWFRVPGDGRADDMIEVFWSPGAGDSERYNIVVYVREPRSHYYTWREGTKWRGKWFLCTNGRC